LHTVDELQHKISAALFSVGEDMLPSDAQSFGRWVQKCSLSARKPFISYDLLETVDNII
jgi:hypothetical protein